MSKTTIRKRIALIAVSALTAGLFSAVTVVPATAGIQASTNAAAAVDAFNVAVGSNTTGLPTIAGDGLTGVTVTNMRSLGLLDKDATSTTAQTATMLSTGSLVFYTGAAGTTTSKAMVASGGTFDPSKDQADTNISTVYASTLRTAVFADASTVVAATWSPGAPGTYTVSLYASTATTASVTSTFPTRGTLVGNITVTVVAASAAGAYSASESACTYSNVSIAPATLDATSTTVTNGQWYVNFNLVDAYGTALPAGALIATATNGALVNMGTGTSTPVAGTTSTHVDSTLTGANRTIRVDQGTAGAPVTTTVTLTYNGTTVCTKTLTIRGSVATMDVSVVGTQDLGASDYAAADYNHDGSGNAGGLFTATLKDSAGNIVLPASTGAFSEVTGSTNDIIRAFSITTAATSTSSTSVHSYSRGIATCGTTAGSREVSLKYTNPVSGVVTTSKPFTLRCADDAATYTASLDKASYKQGEIATLTVQFLDSKGNPANRKTTIAGAAAADAHIVAPMLTAVTSVVGAAANYTVRPDINGKKVYTFSVGTSTGLTSGSYNLVVDYYAMVAAGASKVTVPYTVTTGGDTTTNADVLKSIVALIASINKQIQALQKLILKR
jgi:hypothetical protein